MTELQRSKTPIKAFGKELFGTLLSMERRIALTSIELGDSVGAYWSVVWAHAHYSRLPTRQNAVTLSPSANL